ncbi:MAG: hypothetical protein AAF514_01870 [Verrucomicrobiota bacterium]
MMTLFSKRPWLLIVAAFLLLIGAWATLVRIALDHQPEAIPITPSKPPVGDRS